MFLIVLSFYLFDYIFYYPIYQNCLSRHLEEKFALILVPSFDPHISFPLTFEI